MFYTPTAWNDAKFIPYQIKVIKILRNFTFQAIFNALKNFSSFVSNILDVKN